MKTQFKFLSLIFASFLLFGCSTVKTIENFEVLNEKVYEFEVDNANINIARLWVAETYNSPKKVIQVFDEKLDVLIGNAMYLTTVQNLFSTQNINFEYKIKIQCENNKVSIKFYNFDLGFVSNFLNTTDDQSIPGNNLGTYYGTYQHKVSDFYTFLDALAISLEHFYKTF